ncbi:corA-like Mg2+ transporter domain-containing protein, putative [Eimeria brunetti]|uniref:CorA-like Mg2+ transporter domain-containing protein, putative n=1 Tax=Eimeria brunetti TaxID=51314 RepID=U6LV94_9EIME|nr:corA-like Mg2+ transporter domain-containing protein, putative [Eimeria brunetti]
MDHYESLISTLVHINEIKRAGPPEFAALEALLVHCLLVDPVCPCVSPLCLEACESLLRQVSPLKETAEGLLRYLHEEPSSTRRLRQLSDLKRRLGATKEKARGVQRALRELLEEEEDLLRLELSRFWAEREPWEKPQRNHSAEDVEILLECYEQEVEAIYQVIVRTEDALDDALQLMELHLASTRNAFLKTEIALDILSVFFGFVAAVAGLFGMNIRSGLEDSKKIFWGCFFSSSAASLFVILAVYLWFRRQKL